MSKKRGSLGRGLSVILGNHRNIIDRDITENTERAGSTHKLLISEIKTNPFQPRTEFNEEKLHELSLSIEQLGIIQPITVRKLEKNQYQLISGERRYRASKLAGLKKIPAFIRTANDQQMLEMALVENIQRENLNPIEVALSYQRLIDECKLTQEGCSERVGKNRTTITNFLRLLKLPSTIQKGLSERKISVGHARALINMPDLILADEMTGNLDEDTSDEIINFFLKFIQNNNISLLYVTHNQKYADMANNKYEFKNKKLILK